MPDEPEATSTAPDAELKDHCTSIMVGHAISALDDEASVSLSVNDAKARLSPAGARILAAQLIQWADHAEARNKERPAKNVARLMYRVLAKCDEKTKEWSVAPEPAPPSATPTLTEPPAERAEVHVKLRRVRNPPAKSKAVKRKK